MKTILKYLTVISATLLFFAACSEDNLSVDPELNKPIYKIKDGPSEPLNALVKEYYDRYGSYVLYDYTDQDIRWTWTSHWLHWYAPMKTGDEKYAVKLLTYLKENIYERFTDEFVHRNLAYSIFMADSVCSSVSFDKDNLINVSERQNGIILANAGAQQDDFTEDKWGAIRNDVETVFINGFYNAAPSKPSQFNSLRDQNLIIPDKGSDPLGVYTSQRYNCYMNGWIKGRKPNFSTPETLLQPKVEQDFADYILFLIQTPAAEIKNVMTRFPRVRERVMALVPFLRNILELDVIATQNINCPADPMPADFFLQF